MSLDPANGGGAETLDAAPEQIEKSDPVSRKIVATIEREISDDEIEIPRLPDLASRVLEFTQNPDVSTEEILKAIRMDPVLSGKLIELANSAAFSGAEKIFSLQMAVVRLGLTKVGETAFDLSVKLKAFQKEKRGHLLRRLFKHTGATGFACEELAKRGTDVKQEEAFLTGIFHEVGSPAIVNAIGKLERGGEIPPQNDARVMGLLEHLSVDVTGKIIRTWNLPGAAREAVRLQRGRTRDRRGKPLAHLLACAKELAADLGYGLTPAKLDFDRCRDFRLLGLDDPSLLDGVRAVTHDKMEQVSLD